jgi:hypothetical protein
MDPKPMIGLPSPRILKMIRFGMPRMTRKEFNAQVEETRRAREAMLARGEIMPRPPIEPRKTGRSSRNSIRD